MKRLFKRNKRVNANIRIVSILPNEYLFNEWCLMDMLCSGEECTRENVLELIAIERELVKRGYGDEDGKIISRNIEGFYMIQGGNFI